MMQQELDKVEMDQQGFRKEERIGKQLDYMKRGDDLSFWPKPILHLDKPQEECGRNIVIIKSCGYYN
jgi:hypothetical protein